MITISVDPGVTATGYSIWNEDEGKMRPECTGVIKPIKDNGLVGQTNDLFEQMHDVIQSAWPDTLVLEWPEFMGSSGTGRTAAAKGDLGKLYTAAAAILCAGFDIIKNNELITPSKWKGQLSKDQVARRVAKKLNCEPSDFPNHVMDSVGLFLYHDGRF